MSSQNDDGNASAFMFIKNNHDTQNGEKLHQVSNSPIRISGVIKWFYKEGNCIFIYRGNSYIN